MRNFLTYTAVIIAVIALTPVFMVMGVCRAWRNLFLSKDTLGEFLSFGRLGHFDTTDFLVGTNINNILFDGNIPMIGFPEAHKWLYRMRVYSFGIHEGRLFIKVYRNDKLIERYNKAKDDELPDRE